MMANTEDSADENDNAEPESEGDQVGVAAPEMEDDEDAEHSSVNEKDEMIGRETEERATQSTEQSRDTADSPSMVSDLRYIIV